MKHILIIGIFALLFCACDNFLKEYSQGLAKVENISDLDELLAGDAYYQAAYLRYSYGVYIEGASEFNHFVHFMSDELKQNDRTNRGDVNSHYGYFTWQRQVGINDKETDIGREDGSWNQAYDYINVVNMILAELDDIDVNHEKEEKDKVRIEGEACFLRALYYFSLVNLYAPPYAPATAATTSGVPLKLTSYIEDKEYVCASVAEVYTQILKDLEQAANCLEHSERKSLYRADINAVNLLLSRVCLYMQDYKNARKYAQLVIDRKPELCDLNVNAGIVNVVNEQNPEVIFSMGGDLLTAYMRGYYDDEDRYPFYVSDELADAFLDNDLRKSTYIRETDYGYCYQKIYWGQEYAGNACKVSDNYLFRTAEAYLNLAEAAAFDDDETEARRVLGQLQAKRFHSAPTISESGEALILLIQQERQRELCLEGHRWYDMRRYTVLSKGKWNQTVRHVYTQFSNDYTPKPIRTRLFELVPDDRAFTLAFPKEVLEYQNTLGINNRPPRIPVLDETPEVEDDEEDW